MLEKIIKSDVVLYYIALFIGFIGIIMMVVFVPFKSVATLMMMLSGLGLVLLGTTTVMILILWDLKTKYLDKHHSSIHKDR
jgi:hypothetical protein